MQRLYTLRRDELSVPRFIERSTLNPKGLNHGARPPYGLRVAEVRAALDNFYDFLYKVNGLLIEKGWDRLEEGLRPATFSSLVSELIVESISTQSTALISNGFFNGRPDLLPRGLYPDDTAKRGDEGIEVKASRHASGWQGHNVESGWIMIFQYQIDLETTPVTDREPTKFVRVLCGQLDEDDWSFSGRREGSRRTPTASILRSGVTKLLDAPLYVDPTYAPRRRSVRRKPTETTGE